LIAVDDNAGARRPNILMIVADDLGYADLGCYGQFDFQTPNLDRLAAEGVRFTQGYANSCLCTNTRVALITGRYQYRFTLGNAEPLRHADRHAPGMSLPADHPTLPGLLRAAGYSTTLVGKWHLGALPQHGPLNSGYETFFGISGGHAGYFTHLGEGGEPDLYEGEVTVEREGYLTDLLSERAESQVREQAASGRPFFLSLHYTAPHWPWSAPSDAEQSRARELKVHARHLSHDGGSPRIYAEMVTTMDRGIGRVLGALRDAGAENDTLVIFTSDNGGERYSNMWPFVGRKRDLLEGGLRVPLLFRWPDRIAAGRVCEQVAISMDLTATCLAAAQVQMPTATPLDGLDLLPQLLDGAADVHRTLYWRMRDPMQRALREGRWKYLQIDARDYLFDLEADWRERADFALEQPSRLERMKEQWQAWSDTMLPMQAEAPAGRMIDLASMRW
jgi:arylsulfatase A-like enzyme